MANKRKRKRRTAVHTNLRLPTGLHRELRRAAKGRHTSVNAEILRRLAYGGKPVEWDQQFVWMVHTIQMIWERLYGEQASSGSAAQNGRAPQERPPETGHG
jgi:hypothetical protein